MTIYGNFIRCFYAANSLSDNEVKIALPDGYSMERIHVLLHTNIVNIEPYIPVSEFMQFPPVNSTSPSTLQIRVVDTSKDADLRFLIEKFGQIPNANYFAKAFEPLLITNGDTEYNVIPSDQFNRG